MEQKHTNKVYTPAEVEDLRKRSDEVRKDIETLRDSLNSKIKTDYEAESRRVIANALNTVDRNKKSINEELDDLNKKIESFNKDYEKLKSQYDNGTKEQGYTDVLYLNNALWEKKLSDRKKELDMLIESKADADKIEKQRELYEAAVKRIDEIKAETKKQIPMSPAEKKSLLYGMEKIKMYITNLEKSRYHIEKKFDNVTAPYQYVIDTSVCPYSVMTETFRSDITDMSWMYCSYVVDNYKNVATGEKYTEMNNLIKTTIEDTLKKHDLYEYIADNYDEKHKVNWGIGVLLADKFEEA